MRALLVALLLFGTVVPGVAQSCEPGPTALVLSGGGAKGLAHIGVLRAMDSLGLRPDLVVGTSMGAIVGALYAGGYTARQIDSLARALPISQAVRPFRTAAPHSWDERVPLLFVVKGRRGFELQTGVVDETAANARLNAAMLRPNLLARGRFDRLPIPFRAVATDLRDRSTVVFASGDLARAVRASSAIPLIFPPVVHDGAVLVDGGLSANIPVAEARAAGAIRLIVSDVTEHPVDTLDVESPIALADQLLGFLFRQPPFSIGEEDIYVRPDVQAFRSLDFSPESVAQILERGRRAADTLLARTSCLTPRASVPPPALPDRLAGWSMQGGSDADSLIIARMLGLQAGQAIEPDRLRDRLERLTQAEAFRGVWLNPEGGPDSVWFRIQPIHAPRTVAGAGLAYDHELGGRAWAGIFDRKALGTTFEASALVSLGRLQREVFGTVLSHVDAGSSPLTPMATIRLRTEDVRRFDADGESLAALPTSDARLNLALEARLGPAWRMRGGVDALTWGTRETRGHGALGVSARVRRTGDPGPTLTGEAIVTGAFQSVDVRSSWPILRRSWSIVPTVRAGWGEDLPAQWTFPLGGEEGFPGLHLGERRGSRHASAAVRLGYSIQGAIELRLLVAGGRAWSPGREPEVWLGGARLGIGADTPVGPMDVAYGVASNGRGALYLRLGAWW